MSSTELEAVRRQELQPATDQKRPNIFIGTLNIVMSPMRAVIDPVKKICYPRLEAHWEEKYKRRFPKHAGKLLIFDLILLFLASTLAVSLVLVYTVLPDIYFADPVSVSLEQPISLVSGQQTELIFNYASGSDLPVRDAQLIVETSVNFVPIATAETEDNFTLDPNRPTRRIYDLGDLSPQAHGRVNLSGQAFGSPGQTLPILLSLTYWEQGRAERTTTSVFYQLPIEATPLSLEMKFEEPFLTDTVSLIQINYENQGESMLPNVIIRLSPPSGFRLTGSRPPTWNTREWHLGNLAPKTTGTIALYGLLKRDSIPSFVVSGLAEIVDGEPRLLNELRLNADTESTGFSLTQDVSGLSSLIPGQETEIFIHYANTGNQTLKNVSISLEATGEYLAESEKFPLIWSPTNESTLSLIPPGATGTLIARLTVAAARTQDELNGKTNPSIKIAATGSYTLEDKPARIFNTDSEITYLPIATIINVDTAALYHTKAGDQLGTGPIPPKAGENTRLWVVLSIDNGSNAVRNTRLTATLMPGVEWVNKTSVTLGRPLTYIAANRELIWEIGDLPAFLGNLQPQATANFEIEVQPQIKNVGQVLKLLDYIKIEGEDTFTGVRVTAQGEPVTSAVRFGSIEAQTGIVQ